jgi:two-component system phosphate regulon response regulator OmpR
VTDTARVLVVDDDPTIREMLTEYLASHGYEVSVSQDGASMRAEIERALPDVILLDVQMPGEDGLTLARYLRERYDVGIIMVTGAADTIDRVIGLEMGADDYIGKPFDPRELRARLKSVLRRLQARPPGASTAGHEPVAAADVLAPPPVHALASPPPGGRRVRIGDCTLDLVSHQLFDRDAREIRITTMEFDLLKVFAARPNQVLSRDQLLTLTRNREWEPFDRSIDIRIARLRRKIEADPENPQAIRTVRGIGYMYVPPP